ncbi:NADP-dependent oxidoreductase [Solicola gregarius]|uniref:NADP-dependent oxidoreductase n=1 Tax=Solicola gregarius TaxID=2908642 RepID=A0AA46YLW8_9ACTN|nr:NADP-dependent oxidoreductase [Solicola gregarius]UYM07107.1 NADP-dependent oxidoreductase [Solicola gregarius]
MTVTVAGVSREWHQVRRPRGRAAAADLALVEVSVPEPQPGQLLVRNTHISVDPYMRGRMDDRPSYIPPFPLNAPLDGGALGVVVESRADGIEPGQVVEHFMGLRESVVVDAAAVAPLDLAGTPPEAYLGALGSTGLAAWIGITKVASVQPGDTVFVTGAAGAVGSIAGQIAKLRGAERVIGSAGSAAKVQHLVDDLGYDHAFDYHDGDVGDQLDRAAPNGIDVVFDNVGGAQLEAAIGRLNVGSRLALCGMASGYDGREAYGVRNLYELVTKRATAQGFLVTDHLDQLPAFRADVLPWVLDGQLKHTETVLDGIDQVPDALLGMLQAGTTITGKLVVRLADSA